LRGDAREVRHPGGRHEEEPVADLAYALLIIVGFALLALTLRGLERL
jgi:hypothetical protein